jgi:hypothetical protein
MDAHLPDFALPEPRRMNVISDPVQANHLRVFMQMSVLFETRGFREAIIRVRLNWWPGVLMKLQAPKRWRVVREQVVAATVLVMDVTPWLGREFLAAQCRLGVDYLAFHVAP